MKLSIIIPLYNVGQYIDRCLSSILEQSNFSFDWEIILIDDGSKDDTASKVKAYNNKNIFYYFQANAGAGAARNKGIEHATGTHIWFIDADDFIEHGSFSKIEEAFSKFGNECTFGFGYNFFTNETQEKRLGYSDPSTNLVIYKSTAYLMAKPFFLWNLILQKDVIDKFGIRFLNNVKNIEDFEFSLKYFDKIENAIYIDFITYNYCNNLNSTSRSKTRENLEKLSRDSNIVHLAIHHNLNNNYYLNSKDINYWLQYSVIGYFYSLFKNDYTKEDCKIAYQLYKKEGILQQFSKSAALSSKMKVFKLGLKNEFLFNIMNRIYK